MRLISSVFLIGFIVGITASLPSARVFSTVQAAQTDAASVVSDPAGVVKILIKGQEVARFDNSGLHVRDNIEYGGYSLDFGRAGYDTYLSGGVHAQ